MAPRPPRIRPGTPNPTDGTVITPVQSLAPNRVLGQRQHIVYDIENSRPIEGYNINEQGHLSSNTKIAALAFIARLRGVDYIRQNHAALQRMMSLSHNDATIVEVARAMNHPNTRQFQDAFRPLSVSGDGRINRANDNVIANRMPEDTRAFFDTYRAALMREQSTLGIQGARIGDTSGRAETGLHNGTSQASPLHVAHLVDYLYRLDNGQTLSSLGNPANGAHTASYLRGRNQPGNGQVFFAKTGTLIRGEYDHLPDSSSNQVARQNPNGVYVLTVGYMQEGQPRVVFFRANSDAERRQMATQFLDDVAGVRPSQRTERRPPRPTSTA